MKIFDKLLRNSDELDQVEKVSIICIIMFTVLYIIIHGIFAVWYTKQGIPEMMHMNIVSMVLSLITLWFLLDVKKLNIGGYLLIINFCYYAIYSTYLVGYNKDATMLYPIMVLLLHTLFPKQQKYIARLTTILILGFFVNMYLKYNRVAPYEDSLDYIDWVNYAYAFTAVFMFIYTRSVAENFVNNYNKQVDKMTKEANVDFLTGLYNRRFIENRFLVEECKGLYIVLADLDFLKKVNDTCGHMCGDYIIKEIAQILKASFGTVDDVCRWGGEEFLIYIRDTEELDIEKKLNEVREEIEMTLFNFNDRLIRITMTFGYSEIFDEYDIIKNLENADKALLYGKQTGRNKVVNFDDIENI